MPSIDRRDAELASSPAGRAAVLPFPLGAPVYESASGGQGPDPGALLGPRPSYSLARLAAYFTGPALYRDFRPECPWTGIRVIRPPAPAPGGDGGIPAFRAAFLGAVRQAAGTHACVSVAFSGGMDSAAVLHAAWEMCREEGRRLVAITLDADDDEGRPTPEVAQRVIEALSIGCSLVTVDTRPEARPEAEWTPHGPRFDSEPRLHRALAETAARSGAGVLLHGTGADQLLRAPQFLTGELIAAGRIRAAARYAADRRGDKQARGEMAALAARSLPPVPGGTAYLAFGRRDLSEAASPVLTDRAAAAARQWLADTAVRTRAEHARRSRSWAVASAVDGLFPADPLERATELTESAPFFAPAVVTSAWNIPITKRYLETLPTPYFRGKALSVGLLPGQAQRALVGHRQRGYLAYSRYWQREGDQAPRLEALGIIRPGWRASCRSAFDAAMVHACERWVTGAEERGAEPDLAGM